MYLLLLLLLFFVVDAAVFVVDAAAVAVAATATVDFLLVNGFCYYCCFCLYTTKMQPEDLPVLVGLKSHGANPEKSPVVRL